MLLLIDNYDSFTWNLQHALAASGTEVHVVRNDAWTVERVLAAGANGIVLSPGPGRPHDAGVCAQVLQHAPAHLPILGVCLGHQALVESCGGALELDPQPVHGRASAVYHDGQALFAALPNPFDAGRYHSLRAVRAALPPELIECAWTESGVVMAVRHATRPRFGVQFHPESILTPQGERLLERFLTLCGEAALPRRLPLLRERATPSGPLRLDPPRVR